MPLRPGGPPAFRVVEDQTLDRPLAIAGDLRHSLVGDREDAAGLKFGDELERIGWKGDEKVGDRKMHAMFELHIEQGPILEAENKDIGVVTHGQGLRWIECTVTGKDSHTGSTPMHMRKNAGRGLALVTELVHEIAMKNQKSILCCSWLTTLCHFSCQLKNSCLNVFRSIQTVQCSKCQFNVHQKELTSLLEFSRILTLNSEEL